MTQLEFLSLESLFTSGRNADTPVAIGPEGTKTWGDLIRGISGWRAAFAIRPAPSFTLYNKDGWVFTCALLGAWAAGKHVAIPGDDFPATLAKLGLPRVSSLLAAPANIPDWPHYAPNASALTMYTSGSTGEPAAFPKSFKQLNAEIETLEDTFQDNLGTAAILSTVSHQHIYGLWFKILWPLCAGRIIYLPPLFYPEEIIAAARSLREAALVTSPAHLKRLPEAPHWAAIADRWRAIFSSGGPLPFETAQLVQRIFTKAPIEVYGSSETGGVAWRERNVENVPWRHFPKVEVKLDTTSGALCVRSPHLPDERWFVTSDRAIFTNDGFELLGRLDRIVKVGEKRISLTSIENSLLASHLVQEVRILPLTLREDRLGAVLVPSEKGLKLDNKTLKKRLLSHLAGSMEKIAIPKRWRFVTSFPINSQSKTTESALLRLLQERPRLPELMALKRENAAHVDLALRLPRDLFYFKGHFLNAPILPGVVQVDWAVHYGKELLGVGGEFRKIEALKFQRVLQPGDEMELRLHFDTGNGMLKFEYHSARGRHSSGAICFRQQLDKNLSGNPSL